MNAETVEIKAGALTAPVTRRTSGKGTDWAGLWFDIIEKHAGEFVGMRAGRHTPGVEAPEWLFYSHAACDGLGWFATLLRKEAQVSEITIPRLKETEKPSMLAQARALLQLLARKPEAAAMWKTWDPGWHSLSVAAAGNAIALQAFDVADTRRLADLAGKQGVSLNSLLLAALGRASEQHLQDGSALWMVPVNMRGPVNLEDETANHTAYLQIRTGEQITPQRIHQQIKSKLACNEHWGGWLFLNCGRVVGYAGMKWLYRRELERAQGRPWTGAFSNLGTWKNCGQWFVCPPVAKACPLGVGVVICEGSLSLTIEAHPSIAREAAWTRTLMERWITELQGLAA